LDIFSDEPACREAISRKRRVPVIQRGKLCLEAKQVAPRVAEALAEAQAGSPRGVQWK